MGRGGQRPESTGFTTGALGPAGAQRFSGGGVPCASLTRHAGDGRPLPGSQPPGGVLTGQRRGPRALTYPLLIRGDSSGRLRLL